MRNVAVLAFIAIAFVLSIKSSVVSMLVYWWFAIFRPQDWVYIDLSSARLPLIALVIFTLSSLTRGAIPKVNDSIAKLMLLWGIISLLSSFFVGCEDIFHLIDPFTQMPITIFAVLLSVAVIKNRQHLFYWVAVVGISLGFYSGKSGLLSLSRGGSSNYGADNLTGLFSGSNAYASGSATLLFFMIFVYQQTYDPRLMGKLPNVFQLIKPRYFRCILLMLIVGTIFNVVSLQSRASGISMIIGLVVLYMSGRKVILKMFLWVPVALVVLYFTPLPDGYKERIQSVFVERENLDNSAASRPYFWKAANNMVADYPLGVGVSCFKAYFNVYEDEYEKYGVFRDVHSSHFQVLSETGYIGLLFWLLLHMICFLRNMKLRKLTYEFEEKLTSALYYRQLSTMLICSQIVFFISGSFYSLAYGDVVWIIFGLTIAQSKLFYSELKKCNSTS